MMYRTIEPRNVSNKTNTMKTNKPKSNQTMKTQTNKVNMKSEGGRKSELMRAGRRPPHLMSSAYTLGALVIIFCAVFASPESNAQVAPLATSYNGQVYSTSAATVYANTWWNGQNGRYNYYPNEDCANFVSQCLIAGGLDLSTGSTDAYGSIINTTSLKSYLTSIGASSTALTRAQFNSGQRQPSWFLAGDVVIFENDSGSSGHAMFAIARATYATLAAHTINTDSGSIAAVFNSTNPLDLAFTHCTFYNLSNVGRSVPNSTAFNPGDSVMTTSPTSNLNMREGPGVGYNSLTSFPYGTILTVQPNLQNGTAYNGYYWWYVSSSGGTYTDWCAEYYLEKVSPPTVAITFATAPAGLQVTVDGTTYTTPITFNWTPGAQHTLNVPTPQYFGLYSRYQFSGAQNQTITTPSSSTTYTANFGTEYALTVSAGAGGSVSSGGGWYSSGTVVPISATANSGYSFSSWTGSGSGSYSGNSSSASVTMNAPIFETANFTPNPVYISLTVQPSPSGRSFTVDGTTYTTSQIFSWVSGSSHTIAATSPQSGGTGIQYAWSSWSDGGGISHTVAPTSGTTYTANFSTQYYLTISAGTGGSASPASGWNNSGTVVSISATASGGYAFSSWTGSGSGSYSGVSSFTSVTMNGPITETASFTPNPISVTVQPNPLGRSFTVDGTAYTTSQTFSWVSGSSHTIATTSPQSGGTGIQYAWSSWSDGGGMSHSVAPTSGTTYTASFTTQYYLTMNAGTGGSVSSASGWYNSGTGVGISATASGGYSFSSWTGSGSGSYSGASSSTSVTMNGPITETANFTPNPISVTVQTSPSGRSFTVDGTAYTSPQTFSWVPGSSHTIATTSPQSGGTGIQYAWSSWSDGGGMSHSAAPTSGTTYTASFATQYYLTMNAGTGGSVSPASGWNNNGTVVPISATASGGYAFSSWTGSGSGSYSGASSSTSVTMNGPITETATFTPLPSSTTVFSDNFNDNSLDPTKWTTSGNTITEASQMMQVLTTVTDQGGVLASIPVPINPHGDITVTRRASLHYANQYFAAQMNVKFGNLAWAGVRYANYIWAGNPSYGWENRYGIYLSRNDAYFINQSSDTNLAAPFSPIWDTWFTEKLVYSPDTGNLQYFTNDQKVADYSIGIMPPSSTPTIQFQFGAWGWYTGHQQLFDDFLVTQAAVAAPQVQLTGMSISNRVFRFVLNGPVGSNYVVKVSTNLVNWSPLSTNTISAGGWVIITDSAATNMPRRFYRATAP